MSLRVSVTIKTDSLCTQIVFTPWSLVRISLYTHHGWWEIFPRNPMLEIFNVWIGHHKSIWGASREYYACFMHMRYFLWDVVRNFLERVCHKYIYAIKQICFLHTGLSVALYVNENLTPSQAKCIVQRANRCAGWLFILIANHKAIIGKTLVTIYFKDNVNAKLNVIPSGQIS